MTLATLAAITTSTLLFHASSFAAVSKKLDAADIKDRKAIRKVVLSKRKEIRQCYLEAAAQQPKLEGKVMIKWEILPYGKVGRVNVSDSEVNNVKLERCLASRVKRWRFPARGDIGTRKVTYPFVFLQSVASNDLEEAVEDEKGID